jgi:hypothetical protein|tara:strand:- start:597 stop:1106 length:510 start_codon:yes stop_codon:yes gene_type:complete
MPSRVKLNIPKSLWTSKNTLRLAQDVLASIKLRTSKGLDANGKRFKAYSTNPLYVSKRGARLKPKGGQPTPSGESVYYEGGYQQYKHESRRRGSSSDSADVDLVLSGNMMNNLVVKEATKDRFVIGLTENALYGYRVNQTREFLGLSPSDVDVLLKAAEAELSKRLGGK